VSHLTKTETSHVTWLNIVTIVARSVRLLPAHMQKDVQYTPLVNCIVNDDGQANAMTSRKRCFSSQHLFR